MQELYEKLYVLIKKDYTLVPLYKTDGIKFLDPVQRCYEHGYADYSVVQVRNPYPASKYTSIIKPDVVSSGLVWNKTPEGGVYATFSDLGTQYFKINRKTLYNTIRIDDIVGVQDGYIVRNFTHEQRVMAFLKKHAK